MPEQSRQETNDWKCVMDQRRESRVAVDGRVYLVLNHDAVPPVEGTLIDVSASGFRAHHECGSLLPGKVVKFEYFTGGGDSGTPGLVFSDSGARSKSGWAKVIWTRTQDALMESGFYVVLSD